MNKEEYEKPDPVMVRYVKLTPKGKRIFEALLETIEKFDTLSETKTGKKDEGG